MELRNVTFQEGGALLDVAAQLFKDPVDFLLCSDEMLEWRRVHLRHQSLILLSVECVGIGSREHQRHGTGQRNETLR